MPYTTKYNFPTSIIVISTILSVIFNIGISFVEKLEIPKSCHNNMSIMENSRSISIPGQCQLACIVAYHYHYCQFTISRVIYSYPEFACIVAFHNHYCPFIMIRVIHPATQSLHALLHIIIIIVHS